MDICWIGRGRGRFTGDANRSIFDFGGILFRKGIAEAPPVAARTLDLWPAAQGLAKSSGDSSAGKNFVGGFDFDECDLRFVF